MQAVAGSAGRGRAGEHELEEHGADTVLYYARAGDLEGVKRMVEADPRQANYQRIVTPLMWAAYCGHVKVVRFLLSSGAQIDRTEEGKGRTALYLASGRGHAEVVHLLLQRGADPTIKRKGGWCPLSVAASEAHVNVVRILLAERRVDVDSRDNDGSTALYRASLWGCKEAVRELLRRGADPTIPGGGGLTPVTVARARGHRACIEALEDADRVYELAKARRLLRMRSLLERLSPSDPAHLLSSTQGHHDQAAHLRAHLEGGLELPPLPLVTLFDADPTTPLSAATDGAAAAPAPAGGTSLWAAWLRGGSSSGRNHRSSNSSSSPIAAAAAAAAPPAVVEPAPTAPCTHLPHAGLTKADLAPAVAALAVQGLSYDTFLAVAEMLV